MAVTVSASSPPSPAGPASLVTERDRLAGALRARRYDSPAAVAADLRSLRQTLQQLRGGDEPDHERRLAALVAINEAVGRLRGVGSIGALIQAAPAELCRSCGFSRAMISRVRGSMWVPEVLHVSGDAPQMPAFADYVDVIEIPLEHMLLETDLVRRRLPAHVQDARTDPRTFKEIIDIAGVRSYAAAPIMPARRVIGFFHVDRKGQEQAVDVTDRENLWAFAEHFGLLFERAVLIDRLERQRAQIHDTLMRAARAVDDLCHEELALTRDEYPVQERRNATAARPSALSSLLSAREREVLELVASGATNTVIAQQLVVSQGTVKSHVKRILRKLHVANRAEAVARYVQLLRLDQQGPEP